MIDVGDRVALKPGVAAAALAGAEATVISMPSPGDKFMRIVWDRNDRRVGDQQDGGYYPDMFTCVETPTTPEPDDLKDGYYEPCSTYRACVDGEGKPIIEAVRVKIIARCSDDAEAKRIADALNFVSGNADYQEQGHN